MGFDWKELLHLATRWFHVVVGVAWIGQTWLFAWMDQSLEPAEDDGGEKVEGRLWMVHSGGFYRVDKARVTPDRMPRTLHWFRWEAALTWLSGLLMLWIVYYTGGILVEAGSDTGVGHGIALGLGTLAAGWIVYDLLWRSPLERREALGTTICFGLLMALSWYLSQRLSGRAAFIHVGALFGTIMAANVWQVILPAQRKLVAATRAGEPADPALAARAKQRSKHNTFLSVPLLFIMISSHFPTSSYGHRYNWILLGVFVLLGWAGRKLMTVLK